MLNINRKRICFYSSMFEGRSSAWEIAEFAVKKGVGGIELMNFCDELESPDMTEALKIGKYAKENGLSMPCFSVGVNLYSEKSRRERIGMLRAYADICAALEIPYLHHTTISYLEPEKLTKPTDEMIKIAVDASLEVAEYANSLGVSTIVENQGFVVNGIENYGAFIEGTDNRVGVLLDVGNMMFADENAEKYSYAFADRARHVHIKDYIKSETGSHRTKSGNYIEDCEIGIGDIDLNKIVTKLETSGYNGFYSLEFVGVKDEAEVDRVLSRMENGFSK